MEDLIQAVAEKTGLTPDQAKGAIIAVVDHLKEHLPWGLGEKVETFINTGSITDAASAGGEDLFADIKGKVSGLFS